MWKNVLIHPIRTCFVVGGRPSCLYQPGEAPACHSGSLFLKPNLFQDICISRGSFTQHANDQPKLHGVVGSPCAGSHVLLSSIFMCSQQRAGLRKQVHPFLMISPPASLLHCYLWVSKTSLVSLDVRDFSVVMPGWREITKACLKRYFQLILHVAFFGIQMSSCERAWLDASGMWRNEAVRFRMGLERIGLSSLNCMRGWWFHWVSLGSPPKPVCLVGIFSSRPLSLGEPCLHGDIFTVRHEGIDGPDWQHDDGMCP